MITIRDYYEAAIEHKEQLLRELIELIVFEKRKMTLDQPMEEFKQKFLNPAPEKIKAWNTFYLREIEVMRANKSKKIG